MEKVQPYVKNTGIWNCPSRAGQANARYGWNISGNFGSQTSVTLAQIQQPAQMVVCGDSDYTGPFFRAQNPGSCPTGQGITNWACISKRHMDGSNFAFADGHVKWYGYESAVAAYQKGDMLWVP